MARTETTVSRERISVIRRYPWPENLLNWWTIVMLATGGLITGVFGDFMSIQSRMGLGTPWSVTFFQSFLSLVYLVFREVEYSIC